MTTNGMNEVKLAQYVGIKYSTPAYRLDGVVLNPRHAPFILTAEAPLFHKLTQRPLMERCSRGLSDEQEIHLQKGRRTPMSKAIENRQSAQQRAMVADRK
jgi:hypothetical protein